MTSRATLAIASLIFASFTYAVPASAQEQASSVKPAAPAATASAPRRRVAQARPVSSGGLYFIEFRSRYAQTYGHTYAAFGRLNTRGQIIQSEVAGLHPAGAGPELWTLGHLIPVPSETGPSDGDLEDKYISNRYRVTMNEAEYVKVVAKIRQMQASTPLWSATVYNCNAFVGDIARFMGLRAPLPPAPTLQVPPIYIGNLKSLNNGQSFIPPGSI